MAGVSLPGMSSVHPSKQLICIEPELRRRLRKRRRAVGLQEEELNSKMEEYVILEVTLEKFLVEGHLPKTGKLPAAAPKKGPKKDSPRPKASPRERVDPLDCAELKRLYRDLAKRYHPDRAEPEDREYFERRMAEINAAFESGDLVRLKGLKRRSTETLGGADGLLGGLEDLRITELVLRDMIGLYIRRIGYLKESRLWSLMNEAQSPAFGL